MSRLFPRNIYPVKKFQITGTRGWLSSLLGRTSTLWCLTRKGTCLWCSVSISAEATRHWLQRYFFKCRFLNSWVPKSPNPIKASCQEWSSDIHQDAISYKATLPPDQILEVCGIAFTQSKPVAICNNSNTDGWRWLNARLHCQSLCYLTQSSHLAFESSYFIALT